MMVTFVAAIAFDWVVTMVAHAIVRDTTISSRANRGVIPTRTARVRFTVLLTISTERTFLVQCGAWDSNSVSDRTTNANTLTLHDVPVRFSA
jgi:hypothetical protein